MFNQASKISEDEDEKRNKSTIYITIKIYY